MKVMSPEDIEKINDLYDGQASTRRHSPPNYINVAQKAWDIVFQNDEISPGFNALSTLYACKDLQEGRGISYPYVPKRYLASEVKAKGNPYLPTVGVELEIPYTIELEEKRGPYATLTKIGFTGGEENCRWEFSLPYSFSWSTQSLLLHSLLDLEFIPFDQSNIYPKWDGREVPDMDYYSLHYNLGIPKGIDTHSEPNCETEFQTDAVYLSIACGLAFSTPGRLLNRKTSNVVTVDKEAVSNDKIGNTNSCNRLEIRTLGFGHQFSYRQLTLIQEIGAAFFAYNQQKNSETTIADVKHLALSILWDQARSDLKGLISSEVISLFDDTRKNSKDRLRDILENTELKYKTLKYFCNLAKTARSIMSEDSSPTQHLPNP